jgi:hypothetical protein
VKEGKEGGKMEGRKFFSLSVTQKDAPKSAAVPQKSAARTFDQLDDDIPAW